MQRIAVVEDNPDNRMVLEALLEDDYELEEYGDGISAVEGIIGHPPALVLLDISLPGMDGVEVFERLRASPGLGRLPIVALTAHAMSGDRQRFEEMGFDAYLSKPITDEDLLLGTIAGLLAR